VFKRILWFMLLGVLLFVFISTFPFDNPRLFWSWLTETAFDIRAWFEGIADWFLPDSSSENDLQSAE